MLSTKHIGLLAALICTTNGALDFKGIQQTINILDKGTSAATTVSSKGPDLVGCGNYAFLNGAMYCDPKTLAGWKCPFCKQANSLGYKFAGIVKNDTANTFCFFSVNKGRKEIVLACRGSYNVANFLEDAMVQQVGPECSAGGGRKKGSKGKGKKRIGRATGHIKVHAGFKMATCSVYSQIVKKFASLLQRNKGYSLAFTGHSLGAAMSNIAGHLVISGKKLKAGGYSYCGFGEPRVGNKAYADWWNGQSGVTATRVVQKLDPVPHIFPTALGYLHHGTELWFDGKKNVTCSKTKYEDPNCSNGKGPAYNVLDHLMLWNVNVAQCAFINPLPFIKQVAVPIGG